MMGDFRASLYDIFGYLLPGIVSLAAICLAYAAIGPSLPATTLLPLTATPTLILATVVSYLLGHLAHSLGNTIPWLRSSAEDELLRDGGAPKGLVASARARIEPLVGSDLSDLSATELFALIDESRVLRDRSGDRAVYIYREGFYRGMVIATGLLTIVLIVLSFRGSLRLTLSTDACVYAGRRDIALTVVISSLAMLGYYGRMKRFARYRVQRLTYQWALASKEQDASPKLR
jgi:hypothetical protein